MLLREYLNHGWSKSALAQKLGISRRTIYHWIDPAVENQATDRAFRIGQHRNVLVHKLICQGTVEEKIDEMIEGKTRLSGDILEGGAEALLTEMSDQELLAAVALDIHRASI